MPPAQLVALPSHLVSPGCRILRARVGTMANLSNKGRDPNRPASHKGWNLSHGEMEAHTLVAAELDIPESRWTNDQAITRRSPDELRSIKKQKREKS